MTQLEGLKSFEPELRTDSASVTKGICVIFYDPVLEVTRHHFSVFLWLKKSKVHHIEREGTKTTPSLEGRNVKELWPFQNLPHSKTQEILLGMYQYIQRPIVKY